VRAVVVAVNRGGMIGVVGERASQIGMRSCSESEGRVFFVCCCTGSWVLVHLIDNDMQGHCASERFGFDAHVDS